MSGYPYGTQRTLSVCSSYVQSVDVLNASGIRMRLYVSMCFHMFDNQLKLIQSMD